jgi:hypothetical protein
MGGFQYVYFAAIDRPLSDAAFAYMRSQSTRAEISKREFRNDYNFGSFRGNSREMLRRGFDVHLFFSDYDVREVMFRLPFGLPIELSLRKRYFANGEVDWIKDKKGHGGILSICPQIDREFFGDYGGGYREAINALEDARQDLMDGDLRLYYLCWLACSHEMDEAEPPLPAGLGQLNQPILNLAHFLGISSDLLTAAASGSPDLKQFDNQRIASVKAWLKPQARQALQALATQLLSDKNGEVRREALSKVYQGSSYPAWPIVETHRTYGQLIDMSNDIEKSRIAQRQSKANEQRMKHLAQLASQPAIVIKNAKTRIKAGKLVDYLAIAQDLADLCEALGPELGPATVYPVVSKIVLEFPHRKTLKTAFKSHGLLPNRSQHPSQ